MKKLLFVISQLYKGGAETALVNLLNNLDYQKYEIDLLILNQIESTNVVSLIDSINENVRICDAYKEYKNISVFDRVRAKLIYTGYQKYNYYFTALDFVRGKEYDWAFHIGEWYSPEFIAIEVNAKQKAVWIHSDISKNKSFDSEKYFFYDDSFDKYIFVSQNSLEDSLKNFPFISKKSVVINNIVDVQKVRKMADEQIDINLEHRFVLMTCANVRSEKGYLREVEVMKRLRERNLDVLWLNVGAIADKDLYEKIMSKCYEYGLEQNMIFLGAQENPYKYMRRANAIIVPSDYESWSLVITEAKILGIPVISTKTSGAVEQLIDRETGIICEFDPIDIANHIEEFLISEELQSNIKNNLENFDNTKSILNEFKNLIESKKIINKSILYIIDDINYLGGAHVATKLQINKFLNQGRRITIFSTTRPLVKIRKELNGADFISLGDLKEDKLFNNRIFNVITSHSYSKQEKIKKVKFSIKGRIFKKLQYDEDILPFLSEVFSKFDIVCVMSEASRYREIVANSKCKRKIQWIHTDYCDWRIKTDWTRKITQNDEELYKRFDCVVLLTDNIAKKFCYLYPSLKEKVVVNRNIMPVEEIKQKAVDVKVKNENCVNFVTVGRMDFAKAYPRIVQLASKLKKEGYKYTWKIIGNGEDCEYIKQLINENSLQDEVILMGAMDNPFKEIVKADIFALLSVYEGLPNTIFEALILGIPVLATNVGGISSQIEDGVSGWLVENEFDSIYRKIIYLLMHQDEIAQVKENLNDYSYNNEEIMRINDEIFDYNLDSKIM